MAGEGENLYRIQIAEYTKDGLKGMSYGQSPAPGGDRAEGSDRGP